MRCCYCGTPLRDFTTMWMVTRGTFACLDQDACRLRREAKEQAEREAMGMDVK